MISMLIILDGFELLVLSGNDQISASLDSKETKINRFYVTKFIDN